MPKNPNLLARWILLDCRLVRPCNFCPIFSCVMLIFPCPLETLFACSFRNKVCFTARHFRIKSSCHRRRIVDVEAGTLTIFCNDAKGIRVLVSAAEIMRLSWASVVIRGRPCRETFSEECRVLIRVRTFDTVRRGICNSRPISASVIYWLRPSIRPLSHWLNSFHGFEAMASRRGPLLMISNRAKIYGR